MKEIVGTTTEQNLKDAFISESTSILKYLIFADKSEYEYVEELFKHVAKNEQEHAEKDFQEMIEHGCDTVILAITEFDIDFWFPNINFMIT